MWPVRFSVFACPDKRSAVMARSHWKGGGCLVAVLFAVFGPGSALAGELILPDAAATAVKEAFPNATITGVERERENGVMCYEVNLRLNGRRIEAEVDADGTLAEIEMTLGIADLPKDIAELFATAAAGGRIVRIEKHEIRAVARGGRFVPVVARRIMYEARYDVGLQHRTLKLYLRDPITLPKEVTDAIAAAFPKAAVTEVDADRMGDHITYGVQLKEGERRREVILLAEGLIIAVKTPLAAKDIPQVLSRAVEDFAKGAMITKVARAEIRIAIEAGKIVKRDHPILAYEAALARDGMKAHLEVSADGNVLRKPDWREADDEDDDDEDDDDDDD